MSCLPTITAIRCFLCGSGRNKKLSLRQGAGNQVFAKAFVNTINFKDGSVPDKSQHGNIVLHQLQLSF
jgi:hypothetical protein